MSEEKIAPTSMETFEDVTSIFRDATKLLNDDHPMIFSPQFSLFDSMSAVEIMDPKMDPCYGIHGQKFDDMVTKNIPSSITPETILQLFRELLIREVAFLDGASLLESLNQCYYLWPQSWKTLQDHQDVSSKILLSYVKSLLISLNSVHQSVLTADIFEDEDYQPSSVLSAVFDEDSILEIKNTLLSILQDDAGVYRLGVNDEILLFLRFRSQYLNLTTAIQTLIRECIILSKKPSPENDMSAVPLALSHIKQQSDDLLELLSELQTLASNTELVTDIQLIENSFTMDILKINQNTPARFFPFLSYPQAIGFIEAMVRQISVLCQDLDKILVLSNQDLDHDYLLSYFTHISSLATKFSSGPGTCEPAKGSTCVLPRSFLWGVTHSIRPLMSQILFNSMRSRGIPTYLTKLELCGQWRDIVANLVWDTLRLFCGHRYRLNCRLEQLFERYGSMVADGFMLDRAAENDPSLLSILSTNPTKEQKVEWFIAWAIHLTTGVMDIYMELLMEMELLSYSELACFHWYWDYLISTRAWSVRTMREMKDTEDYSQFRRNQEEAEELLDRYEFQQKQVKKTKAGKKGKQTAGSAAAAAPGGDLISKEAMKEAKKVLQQRMPEKNQLESEEILLTARSQITKGLLRVYLSAIEDKMIRHPDHPMSPQDSTTHSNSNSNGSMTSLLKQFNSAEIQFNCRYNFFQSIASPTPLQYSQYLTLVETIKGIQKNSKELLEISVKCFKSIKDLIERAIEMTKMTSNYRFAQREREKLEIAKNSNLVKISIALSINCMRRLQSPDRLDPSLTPENWILSFDRTHSSCFPIFNAIPK